MKAKEANIFLCLSMVTSLLVAFFIAPAQAAEPQLIFDYFTKIYRPSNTVKTEQANYFKDKFGLINWLPGQEFEIFLTEPSATQPTFIPIDNTPDYIIDNLYKKIEIIQQPTAQELKQEITASLMEHNLPIAVLNVWRPHTVIKIKNLSDSIWQQESTILVSENFTGDLNFFRDPTWLNQRQITTMSEAEVIPGEVATFEFLLDGRGRPLVYDHVYKLQVDGQTVHMDAKGALYWLTRVDLYQSN